MKLINLILAILLSWLLLLAGTLLVAFMASLLWRQAVAGWRVGQTFTIPF